MYSAPLESTAVTVKDWASVTRSFGNGGTSGDLYEFPCNLRQMTHFRITALTHCYIAGIQTFCLIYVTVEFMPECPSDS